MISGISRYRAHGFHEGGRYRPLKLRQILSRQSSGSLHNHHLESLEGTVGLEPRLSPFCLRVSHFSLPPAVQVEPEDNTGSMDKPEILLRAGDGTKRSAQLVIYNGDSTGAMRSRGHMTPRWYS